MFSRREPYFLMTAHRQFPLIYKIPQSPLIMLESAQSEEESYIYTGDVTEYDLDSLFGALTFDGTHTEPSTRAPSSVSNVALLQG